MITLLPHNQPAFSEIMDSYRSGIKKIIYVSGVGTGKSFVFLAIAEALGKKILYVIPKHSIRENMETYRDFSVVKDNVDFTTFNAFTDTERAKELIKDYGMIVIDECHHLGSDLFGRVLLQVMENDNDRLFLGLTATPVRFRAKTMLPDGTIEKNVDISQFFEKKVTGMSNFDAIKLGLMPPFQYRLLEPDKDPKQIEKEYGYEIKVEVDYKKESQNVVKEIVNTYPRNKWICFFSSTKELKEHRNDVKDIFSGYEMFTLYSDLRNLKEVIEGVRKAEKAVILSIDMLLEGVHLPGITGIILYRNVTTVTTFQQILGRVCSIGNKTEPIVVDCSKCGPKLLTQLLNMSADNGRSFTPGHGGTKPIMSIGIGLHKGWERVDIFLARLAQLNHKNDNQIDETALDHIIEDYLKFGGVETDDINGLNKKNKSLLDACCWKYSVNPQRFRATVKHLREKVA